MRAGATIGIASVALAVLSFGYAMYLGLMVTKPGHSPYRTALYIASLPRGRGPS